VDLVENALICFLATKDVDERVAFRKAYNKEAGENVRFSLLV